MQLNLTQADYQEFRGWYEGEPTVYQRMQLNFSPPEAWLDYERAFKSRKIFQLPNSVEAAARLLEQQ